jgi:hypothetical protein
VVRCCGTPQAAEAVWPRAKKIERVLGRLCTEAFAILGVLLVLCGCLWSTTALTELRVGTFVIRQVAVRDKETVVSVTVILLAIRVRVSVGAVISLDFFFPVFARIVSGAANIVGVVNR